MYILKPQVAGRGEPNPSPNVSPNPNPNPNPIAHTQVSAKSASPQVPDVRYSHRAVTLNGNMYVVGGINQFASPNRHGGTSQRCAAVEELLLRTSSGGAANPTTHSASSAPDGGSFPAAHGGGAKANAAMDAIAAMRGELMGATEAGAQVRWGLR